MDTNKPPEGAIDYIINDLTSFKSTSVLNHVGLNFCESLKTETETIFKNQIDFWVRPSEVTIPTFKNRKILKLVKINRIWLAFIKAESFEVGLFNVDSPFIGQNCFFTPNQLTEFMLVLRKLLIDLKYSLKNKNFERLVKLEQDELCIYPVGTLICYNPTNFTLMGLEPETSVNQGAVLDRNLYKQTTKQIFKQVKENWKKHFWYHCASFNILKFKKDPVPGAPQWLEQYEFRVQKNLGLSSEQQVVISPQEGQYILKHLVVFLQEIQNGL